MKIKYQGIAHGSLTEGTEIYLSCFKLVLNFKKYFGDAQFN